MEAAAKPAFDVCSTSLTEFNNGSYEASPFLLMLYDEGRMPFSDRVLRDTFVEFFKEALTRFPFTGTFESYVFILRAIFGDSAQILFDVPAPGKLDITVNTELTVSYDFIAREFVGGEYVDSEIIDSGGNNLVFTGISGIDSQYQLQQLLSELVPAGIYLLLTLTNFTLNDFIAEDSGGNFDEIIDSDGNSIVFIEF